MGTSWRSSGDRIESARVRTSPTARILLRSACRYRRDLVRRQAQSRRGLELGSLTFVPNADDRTRHRRVRENERERALRCGPAFSAQGGADIVELELREVVRAAEVALVERVEREPVGEEAGR